jgi:hypothetical protein
MIDYIDKISFNLKVPKNYMKGILPLKELNRHSGRCHLRYASKKAQEFGYQSRIDIEQPEMKVFLLLAEHAIFAQPDMEHSFLSAKQKESMLICKISRIEIARDVICSSKKESLIHRDFMLEHLRKKHSREQLVYVSKEPIISEIKYSDKTGYWGRERSKSKLIMYPRISKKVNEPCVHSEYKFWGASNIKKKTGISTLKDLINFDFEQFFTQQKEKYITYEKIDYERLGRWVNNISLRENVISTFGKCIKFVYNEAERVANLFCRAEGIKTASDLRKFFKDNQKIINAKKGRRGRWDNKILDLTRYKINTFFNPMDLTAGLI